MTLPLTPPLAPMLATLSPTIPEGRVYEPKWDGFRCLVFRDGDDVVLHSRGGKDLAGYFPELVAAICENTPPHCVLDGEIVVVRGGRMDFVRLTERIHPAASRIARLSTEMPAELIVWDLLAFDDTSLLDRPWHERRERLERALANAEFPVHLSPVTTDVAEAARWFDEYEGAGCDGIMAKDPNGPYTPGERTMAKIKHKRDCDVVVAGYRLHKGTSSSTPLLGSLQCGLYDAEGRLAWIGASGAFTAKARAELAALLADLTVEPGSPEWEAHPWGGSPTGLRRPGGESRWAGPLKETHLISPFLVAEVAYEHMEGDRFRNNPHLLRWRPDRDPESCTFAQLEVPDTVDITTLFR